MNGMLRVPRSRGVLSGLLLVLLGAWGVLIPFVGPYFHYAYTPDAAWTYTSGRLWMEIMPGAAVFLGGLILLATALRPMAMFGAWLAIIGGAWFALGPIFRPLWASMSTLAPGTPVGSTTMHVAEQIGFFSGLGVAIVLIAGLALGRLTVVGTRDVALVSEPGPAPGPAPAEPTAVDEDDRVIQTGRHRTYTAN
jgi:hypothetical protein